MSLLVRQKLVGEEARREVNRGMRSSSTGRPKRGWEQSDEDLLDNMFAHKKFMADVSR